MFFISFEPDASLFSTAETAASVNFLLTLVQRTPRLLNLFYGRVKSLSSRSSYSLKKCFEKNSGFQVGLLLLESNAGRNEDTCKSVANTLIFNLERSSWLMLITPLHFSCILGLPRFLVPPLSILSYCKSS